MSQTADDQTLWSYRQGPWFGVVGTHVAIAVPPSAKDRVAALWEAADDEAGFDAILDTLVSGGLSGLPAFALVGLGESTRILVRGVAVTATVETSDGSEQVDGSAVGTWVERTFTNVSSLRITLDEESASITEDLPLPGGLVRLGQLSHPASRIGTAAPPQAPPRLQAVPAPVADAEPEPEVEPEVDLDGAPAVGLPEEPADDWLSPSVSVAETEMAAPSPPEPEPEPGPDTEPEPGPETEPDPDPLGEEEVDAGAETEMFPVVGGSASAPLAPPPPPPIPAAAGPLDPPVPEAGQAAADPDDDHDGMTRAPGRDEDFSRPQPGIPGQPAAPSVTRTVARLLISNDETVDVDRVILIGRAPEARRFSSTEQPRLVTVPSRLQEISSTHIEVRPGTGVDHGSAVVTDMGSTNGTVLVQPGLDPEDLKAGVAVQLLPGAVINLGDGVTIQVARPE